MGLGSCGKRKAKSKEVSEIVGEGHQREEEGAGKGNGMGGGAVSRSKNDGATQVETRKTLGWRGPCGQNSEEMGHGCGGGNMVPGASGIQRRY